jgi:hypothetical protein
VGHEKVAVELPDDLCKIAFIRSPEIPGAQIEKKEQKSEQKDERYEPLHCITITPLKEDVILA